MAEGPLVSVQHRLIGRPNAGDARGRPPPHGHAATRLQAACAVEADLISAPLELEKAIRPFLHLAQRRCPFRLCFISVECTTPVSSSIRRFPLRFTAATAPSHHPHPSSCAGTLRGAWNCHPTAALPTPTPITGESLAPRTLVQSPSLAAMPHPSGHFPSVPKAREASYPVNPPRRR
jgi:hypothetical protein